MNQDRSEIGDAASSFGNKSHYEIDDLLKRANLENEFDLAYREKMAPLRDPVREKVARLLEEASS